LKKPPAYILANIYAGGIFMNNINRIMGLAVSSFGLGILIAFFLPDTVLVVIEAVVIVTAGVLFLKK